MQTSDDGMLTDGKVRTTHLKNATLVMTSNVGSSRILDIASDAKIDDNANEMHAQMNQVVEEELEHNFTKLGDHCPKLRPCF